MKTAISVPDDTFSRVDAAAARLGVSRSEFFSRAAERWLQDLDDDGTTAAINAVLADAPPDANAEFLAAAARDLARRSSGSHPGEVWWVDFGSPRGSAPAPARPALVVSADQYNASDLRTVTVVALTSSRRLGALPGNVAIAHDVSGLDRDCVADVTQVATLDRAALTDRAAQLPDWLMAQVDDGLRRALAL